MCHPTDKFRSESLNPIDSDRNVGDSILWMLVSGQLSIHISVSCNAAGKDRRSKRNQSHLKSCIDKFCDNSFVSWRPPNGCSSSHGNASRRPLRPSVRHFLSFKLSIQVWRQKSSVVGVAGRQGRRTTKGGMLSRTQQGVPAVCCTKSDAQCLLTKEEFLQRDTPTITEFLCRVDYSHHLRFNIYDTTDT